MKTEKLSSLEREWLGIQGIGHTNRGWMAVANDSDLGFIDLAGSLIKCMSFDRPIEHLQ
jgi:hypothetical protein